MLHGSTWAHTHSHCHQMTQAWPQGFSESTQKIGIFKRTHAKLKTAQSSLVGPHRGADIGYLEIELGSPAKTRVL